MIFAEQIDLDTTPLVVTNREARMCTRCQTPIAASLTLWIRADYPILRVALLPCGCVPSMMDALSPAALTAVLLLAEHT